jgi:peptidyl-prolyl cis-trans isomerase C
MVLVMSGGTVVRAQTAAPPTTQPAGGGGSAASGQVTVRIDDHVIYKENIDALYDEWVARSPDLQKMMNERARKRVWAQMRDRAIDGYLLEREAKRLGITLTEEQLRTQLQKDLDYKIAGRGMTSEEFAMDYLARSGETVEEAVAKRLAEKQFRDLVLHTMLVQKRYPDRLTVAEADIKERYDVMKDRYQYPARAMASHILVAADGQAPMTEKLEARSRAREILKQVREPGVDFAEVARAYSDCPSGAKVGGNLGFFPRTGALVEAFSAAAFALEPGQISDVVQTGDGFHIIKLHAKKEAMRVPYEAVKPGLREFLFKRQMQLLKKEYVKELRGKATIEFPQAEVDG